MLVTFLVSTGYRYGLQPIVLVVVCVGALGCAYVPKRNPLPAKAAEHDLTTVFGIPRARYWGDEPPPWTHQWLGRPRAELKGRYPAVFGHRATFLAISGGGEDGAFAAGLLAGWTASGERPEFTVVTGVSAGALIAPFAFLGPDYDQVLREVAVDLKASDVFTERRLIQGLRSDAMASTAPLQALIAKHVDQELIEKIAEEYRRGRELNVGTSNLDSMRPVVWRVGTIANSGHPRALALIRKILLASASLPGAFPPVLIPVEVGEETYDELHVDGGVTSQVFLYPVGLDYDRVIDRLEISGRPKVYVIRNARLDPHYEAVTPKTIQIAERSVRSLVRTQGIGDLYQIYVETFRDGLEFHLAYIPRTFTGQSSGQFDTAYMEKLYHFTVDLAQNGYPWQKMPPALQEAPIRAP